MRAYSYQISKQRYDYLLPVYGNCGSQKLLCRTDRKIEKYYFIGTDEEHKDLLNRCKYI